MLEFHNESPWSGGLYPGWNKQREPRFIAVFKAGFRFEIDGSISPLDETPPLIESDTHRGKPLESSLCAANEVMPFKQGGEVYLYGMAYPSTPGQRITEVGMGIAFPNGETFKKVLRVFGRRQWQRQVMNYTVEGPEVLEPTPIIYEYAFGGSNPHDPDERYPLNPVGTGLNGKGWKVFNPELPRIEMGPDYVSNPSETPQPAGFGPLPVFWQPRADEYGEVPENQPQAATCPWGEDAEPCLHNVAPHDQRFPQPFTGGEVVHLAGFFPDLPLKQVVRFTVPILSPQLYTIIDGETHRLDPVCDTLVIDTEKREFYLVWRADIAWHMLDPRKGWVVLREAARRNGEGDETADDGITSAEITA